MKLHLGCGHRRIEGYTHIDISDQSRALSGLQGPAQRMRSECGVFPSHDKECIDNDCQQKSREQGGGTPSGKGSSGNDCQEKAKGDEPCSSPPEKRRARDSNPQPRTGHLISNEAASHSHTLRLSGVS